MTRRRGRIRDSGVFRHMFETVLQRCMKDGLVKGEGFATDASIIKADAQRQRGMPDRTKRPLIGATARNHPVRYASTLPHWKKRMDPPPRRRLFH